MLTISKKLISAFKLVFLGGEMFEYGRATKCCGMIVILFMAITLVPWANGERILSQNHEKILPMDSGRVDMELKGPLQPLCLILIGLFALLLMAGYVVLLPLMILFTIPLLAYGVIYAIGVLAYFFLILAPIMLILQTLNSIFPDSSIIDIILNITSQIIMLPVMLAGAFLLLLSLPMVGLALLLAEWTVISFKIAFNIWYAIWFGSPLSKLSQKRWQFLSALPFSPSPSTTIFI